MSTTAVPASHHARPPAPSVPPCLPEITPSSYTFISHLTRHQHPPFCPSPPSRPQNPFGRSPKPSPSPSSIHQHRPQHLPSRLWTVSITPSPPRCACANPSFSQSARRTFIAHPLFFFPKQTAEPRVTKASPQPPVLTSPSQVFHSVSSHSSIFRSENFQQDEEHRCPPCWRPCCHGHCSGPGPCRVQRKFIYTWPVGTGN